MTFSSNTRHVQTSAKPQIKKMFVRTSGTRIVMFGHGGYYNRGCQAIVDSTVSLFRRKKSALEFILLSLDPTGDAATAPRLVERILPGSVPRRSAMGLLAGVAFRISPALGFRLSSIPARRALANADLFLSIGGDNYCYQDAPYYYYVDQAAKRRGIPTVLWGATVELDRPSEAKLADLRSFDLITARDPVTAETLAGFGIVDRVRRVSDPAFALQPCSVACDPFWPHSEGGKVVGLNLSPLAAKYVESGDVLLRTGVELVRHLVDQRGLGVLLIPHVTEPMPAREKWNDDGVFLDLVMEHADRSRYVRRMPSGLSAGQTKFVISRCEAFVGARTHSTIAAITSGVPTLTIAYSAKARGINLEVFGHDRWVVDVRRLDQATVIRRMDELLTEGGDVRVSLAASLPRLRAAAESGVDMALRLLKSKHA